MFDKLRKLGLKGSPKVTVKLVSPEGETMTVKLNGEQRGYDVGSIMDAAKEGAKFRIPEFAGNVAEDGSTATASSSGEWGAKDAQEAMRLAFGVKAGRGAAAPAGSDAEPAGATV